LQTYSKGQKISIALINLLFLRLFKVSAPRSSKFHVEDVFESKLLKKHMIFQRSVFSKGVSEIDTSFYVLNLESHRIHGYTESHVSSRGLNARAECSPEDQFQVQYL
jgi:hypothetical protein